MILRWLWHRTARTPALFLCEIYILSWLRPVVRDYNSYVYKHTQPMRNAMGIPHDNPAPAWYNEQLSVDMFMLSCIVWAASISLFMAILISR